MICLGSSFPLLGSNFPLISQGRSGTWRFGRVEPMVYMHWSPGGSCSGAVWTVAMSWTEEALGVVRLLCSDTLSVRLCWFGPASTRCTFWRLLGGEGGRLEGLTRRPGSPRAPGASGGVCLLVSRPVRDPVGGTVDRVALAGQHWGAPRASVARGAPSRARALVGVGREGAKDRARASVDRETEARASPRALSRGGGRARARAG
jgi:hypothetical protein